MISGHRSGRRKEHSPRAPAIAGTARGNLRVAAVAIVVASTGVPAAAQAVVPHAPAFTSLCGAKAGSHPATVRHVMFILEENRSYRQVIGNPKRLGDPYINNVLVRSCGLAANYHSYSHPSVPNYLALTSGAAKGRASTTDCSVVASCRRARPRYSASWGWPADHGASTPSPCRPTATQATTATTWSGTLRRPITPAGRCRPSAPSGTCRLAP